jgi:hypothetical protein
LRIERELGSPLLSRGEGRVRVSVLMALDGAGQYGGSIKMRSRCPIL